MKHHLSGTERIVSVIVHISSMFGFFIPLITFLINYFVPHKSSFIDLNCKQVLNVSLNLLLFFFIGSFFTIVSFQLLPKTILMGLIVMGFIIVPAIVLFYYISFIIAGIQAYKGKIFTYKVPFHFIVKRV